MLGSFSKSSSPFSAARPRSTPGIPKDLEEMCWARRKGPSSRCPTTHPWRDIIQRTFGGLDHLYKWGKKAFKPDIKVENYIIREMMEKSLKYFFGEIPKRKHGWKVGSWKIICSFWEGLCWGASCLHQGVYVVQDLEKGQTRLRQKWCPKYCYFFGWVKY